jgi:hypothetical protein
MRYVLHTALHWLTFPLVEDGAVTFAGALDAPFTPPLRPCEGKVVMKNPAPESAQRPGQHPPRLALHAIGGIVLVRGRLLLMIDMRM